MDKEQLQVAMQIMEQAAELSRRATEANLATLAYLLECARIEANSVVEGAGSDRP